MTEIQKSKQCLVMEGFGHAQRRRLRRVLNIGYWNLRPARSCLAMAGGFICNLLARRLSGGVLGICDFRHKAPRQSHLYLTWPRGQGPQC